MHLEEFNIWELLAGLGIFLFGMYLMEESIKKLSGRKLKYFIGKFTSSNIKGVLSGVGATAILQSSSAVSLMILAFVGAGIMTLENAFAVIIGSNIGTTATSWIVASIGFKVNIDALALPFIGIGGLMLIFLGSRERTANISKMMVGFGFLFLGLNYMKTSMEGLAAGLDISALQGSPAILFFLVGFVITSVIQSSSATMAIILTSVHSQILETGPAAAMVIGANVGTTLTVIIGSVGGDAEKKRVAASHFLFNFVTGIIALALLNPLIYLVFYKTGLESDPVIGVALFHTLFKFLGFLIFFPGIPVVIRLIRKAIPEKQDLNQVNLPGSLFEVPQAAVAAIREETAVLIQKVLEFNSQLMHLKNNIDDKATPAKYNLLAEYDRLKTRQSDLFMFGTRLQRENLNSQESEKLHNYLLAIKYATSSAKSLKDVNKDIEELREADPKIKSDIYQHLKKSVSDMYRRILALMEQTGEKKLIEALIAEKQHISALDHEITNRTADALKNDELQRDELTYILSVSRNVNQSNRQLFAAVRHLKLTQLEASIDEQL